MKKHLLTLFAGAALLASCSDAPKGDDAIVTDEKTAADSNGVVMTVDTSASVIAFTGWGVGKNHPGKFKLSSGSFTVKDGMVQSGSFVVGVNTLSMDEEGEMFQTKLRGHLLSDDFFGADKNPDAKFEITGSEPYTATAADTSVVAGANTRISGNLTLKGITKNVSFPAKVDVSENSVTAVANFDIDRTQWNMNYNADKESMQDKFIAHEVNIRLNVSGKKAN
jgi:polyisoprenoid-binding protein YceI